MRTHLALYAGLSIVAAPSCGNSDDAKRTEQDQRDKETEARTQLAKIVDAASAYFKAPGRGANRGCPNDGNASGESGVTPPLSVECFGGPRGRCVPGPAGGDKPGSYDAAVWTNNDVWSGMGFKMEAAHLLHYNFKWENTATNRGTCRFTVQAFGDLDGDGVLSTFERTGTADANGVNVSPNINKSNELE